MVKCLIFDCDGTLVDSEYLCNLALEIKLRDYGVRVSAEKIAQRFRGGKLATILETLEQENSISFDEHFVPHYRSLVDDLFKRELQPCAGVVEMLREIDLPKCIASSGPLENIYTALSVTGLSGFFEKNVYSSYVSKSWKPDPGIFLYAAREMGFDPRECVVIEDSLVGIQAAQAAEMHAIFYNPNSVDTLPSTVHQIVHMNELNSKVIELMNNPSI